MGIHLQHLKKGTNKSKKGNKKGKRKAKKKDKREKNKSKKKRKNKNKKKNKKNKKKKNKRKKNKNKNKKLSSGDDLRSKRNTTCSNETVAETCLENAMLALNYEKNLVTNYLKQAARLKGR